MGAGQLDMQGGTMNVTAMSLADSSKMNMKLGRMLIANLISSENGGEVEVSGGEMEVTNTMSFANGGLLEGECAGRTNGSV